MPETTKLEQWPVQSQHTVVCNEMALVICVLLHGANQYLVRKQHRKRNNWNDNLFKVKSQCIRIMKTKWHRWCIYWWQWTDHYVVNQMQWLVKGRLLKVICRVVWLCKLTDLKIYRLTLNKSGLRQTSTVLSNI